VSKIEGGVSNTYVRDGVGVTAPVIRDSFASYTPGVSEKRGSISTFRHSGLKNAETQTNSSSSISATKSYDAFGNQLTSTGTWAGAFGYAGDFGYQEDASGLKLLGHRYYDSSTGRFLTRDPAKDGRNWYSYCDSEPIGNADPNGLDFIGWIVKQGGHTWHIIKNGGPTIKKYIETHFEGRVAKIHNDFEKELPSPSGHPAIEPPIPGERYPADETSKIHVAKEKAADEATHSDWENWRDKIVGTIKAFLPIMPGDIIEAGGAAGQAIDPHVQGARRGFNALARDRWLAE
jgi:RHS repeat-associated protein